MKLVLMRIPFDANSMFTIINVEFKNHPQMFLEGNLFFVVVF